MLAAIRGSGVVQLHIAPIGGHWASMPTYGSLVQGGLEGHPMFCVVLWAAIGQRIEAQSSKGRVWRYVDDIVVHAHLSDIPRIVQAISEGVTCELGGNLDKSKSALRAPWCAGKPWEAGPDELRWATSAAALGGEASEPILPIQEDGHTILG